MLTNEGSFEIQILITWAQPTRKFYRNFRLTDCGAWNFEEDEEPYIELEAKKVVESDNLNNYNFHVFIRADPGGQNMKLSVTFSNDLYIHDEDYRAFDVVTMLKSHIF